MQSSIEREGQILRLPPPLYLSLSKPFLSSFPEAQLHRKLSLIFFGFFFRPFQNTSFSFSLVPSRLFLFYFQLFSLIITTLTFLWTNLSSFLMLSSLLHLILLFNSCNTIVFFVSCPILSWRFGSKSASSNHVPSSPIDLIHRFDSILSFDT